MAGNGIQNFARNTEKTMIRELPGIRLLLSGSELRLLLSRRRDKCCHSLSLRKWHMCFSLWSDRHSFWPQQDFGLSPQLSLAAWIATEAERQVTQTWRPVIPMANAGWSALITSLSTVRLKSEFPCLSRLTNGNSRKIWKEGEMMEKMHESTDIHEC